MAYLKDEVDALKEKKQAGPDEIILRRSDAQTIVDYLVTRPWAEVNSLLAILYQAAQTEPES